MCDIADRKTIAYKPCLPNCVEVPDDEFGDCGQQLAQQVVPVVECERVWLGVWRHQELEAPERKHRSPRVAQVKRPRRLAFRTRGGNFSVHKTKTGTAAEVVQHEDCIQRRAGLEEGLDVYLCRPVSFSLTMYYSYIQMTHMYDFSAHI